MSNKLQYQQEGRENCEKIFTGFTLTNFCRSNESGNDFLKVKDFKEERYALENLLRLAERAAFTTQQVYLYLSESNLQIFKDTTQSLLSLLQRMRTFHETAPPQSKYSPKSGVDEALEELKNDKEILVNSFYPLYERFYDFADKLTIWAAPTEIRAQSEKINKIETGLQIQVNTLLSRLDVQNTISPHAKTFDAYAKEHEFASEAWLILGSILLAVTAWYSHFHVYKEINDAIKEVTSLKNENNAATGLFWGLVLARLFALSISGSVAFWALRNYKINKHNELLNRTKAASLRTFNDFSETTQKSKRTHDIVIKKIADTIFDIERLGYLNDKGSEKSATPSQIIDAILQVSKKD